MSKNYYYLVAGLPDIVPEEKKMNFSSVQFRELLRDELTEKDFGLARLFFLPFDHQNLLNLFFEAGKEWDERGNYTREELEPLIDKKNLDLMELSDFPDYISRFVSTMHSEDAPENRTEAAGMLTRAYYHYLEESPNEYVRQVAYYQRNTGNVMAALNARKYEMEMEYVLMGDDEVTDALRKSRARDFGLSSEVEYMEELVQIYETDNLKEREMKLDMHKWKFLEELTFFNYFSIERVLAFLQKLLIVERWFHLDAEKGREMFQKLFKELKSGFEFPDEYTLSHAKRR